MTFGKACGGKDTSKTFVRQQVFTSSLYNVFQAHLLLLCCRNRAELVPISSLSDVFKAKNFLPHFGKMLENIFLPMFEATINPQDNKELSVFLRHVSTY